MALSGTRLDRQGWRLCFRAAGRDTYARTIGHIGLLETAGMVAVSMGLEVDELQQTKSAIITSRHRRTSYIEIEPGRVWIFLATTSAAFPSFAGDLENWTTARLQSCCATI
ncbi:hypothetical protein [Mesorhizobium sp. M0322]|uniref:hypothetical protein n=1 Tax=Mesorhizobium sp. M0322 TaxID=2956937 RepID=UPI00333559CA